MFVRAYGVAVILAMWVTLRLALRRPVVHPWFVAFFGIGIASIFADLGFVTEGAARYAARALAVAANLGSLIVFLIGLRAETGRGPFARAALLALFGAVIVSAIIVGAIPGREGAFTGQILTAVFLLNALPIVVHAPRRPAGSAAIAVAIVLYAIGRTVILSIGLANAADFSRAVNVCDLITIAAFGVALTIFGIEGAREPSRARPNAADPA